MAAKVTMREPRVQPQLPAATPADPATDSRGRVLTIKKLSLREEMDVLAAAGAERADNRRWMFYATLAACVRSIDGHPLPPPASLRTLLANVDQVGAEGINAVIAFFKDDVEDVPDDLLDTAKN